MVHPLDPAAFVVPSSLFRPHGLADFGVVDARVRSRRQ